MGTPRMRTNNFPESGRGLIHVTPTIFGITVGYPSDSLASCLCRSLSNIGAGGIPQLGESQYHTSATCVLNFDTVYNLKY